MIVLGGLDHRLVAQSGFEPASLSQSPTLSELTLMNLGRPLSLSSVMHRISSVRPSGSFINQRPARWAIHAQQQTPSAATSSMRLIRSGSDRRLYGHPLRLGLPSTLHPHHPSPLDHGRPCESGIIRKPTWFARGSSSPDLGLGFQQPAYAHVRGLLLPCLSWQNSRFSVDHPVPRAAWVPVEP